MQGWVTNARDEEGLSLEASGCLMMKQRDTHTHPNKTPLGSSLWLGGVPHFVIFVFPGPPYGNGYSMSC